MKRIYQHTNYKHKNDFIHATAKPHSQKCRSLAYSMLVDSVIGHYSAHCSKQ